MDPDQLDPEQLDPEQLDPDHETNKANKDNTTVCKIRKPWTTEQKHQYCLAEQQLAELLHRNPRWAARMNPFFGKSHEDLVASCQDYRRMLDVHPESSQLYHKAFVNGLLCARALHSPDQPGLLPFLIDLLNKLRFCYSTWGCSIETPVHKIAMLPGRINNMLDGEEASALDPVGFLTGMIQCYDLETYGL